MNKLENHDIGIRLLPMVVVLLFLLTEKVERPIYSLMMVRRLSERQKDLSELQTTEWNNSQSYRQ